MAPMTQTSGAHPPALASDQVLKIARLDAEQAYRDLTAYRISLAQEADGWHVDYQLKDPGLNGGGPHYLICQQSRKTGSPALLVKGGRPLSRRRQACSTAGGAGTVVAALVSRATAPAPGGAPTPRGRTSGA